MPWSKTIAVKVNKRNLFRMDIKTLLAMYIINWPLDFRVREAERISFYYFVANLSLNQSFIVNDQCSGSPYASCLGEKCSCIEGYIAVNSTDCVLSTMQIYYSYILDYLFLCWMMLYEIKTVYSVNAHKHKCFSQVNMV